MYSYARGYLRRCVELPTNIPVTKLNKAPALVLKPVENDYIRLYAIPRHRPFYIPFVIYGYEVYMRY